MTDVLAETGFEGPDGEALARLARMPHIALGHYPTPVEEMTRLREALGGGPRLLVKRDDAIAFGFGGSNSSLVFGKASRIRTSTRRPAHTHDGSGSVMSGVPLASRSWPSA